MSKITEHEFLKDVATHQMQVIRDDGLYRHVRFKRPGTMCMHFDLITWPGCLCYTGDMGTYVFSRIEDMIDFFRDDRSQGKDPERLRINLSYWAEKARATDRDDGIREYSAEKFAARLREVLDEHIKELGNDIDPGFDVELRQEFARQVLAFSDDGPHAAYEAANRFEHGDFRFHEVWEYDFTDYTHRFVWCCYALAWAVKQYDAKVVEARTA